MRPAPPAAAMLLLLAGACHPGGDHAAHEREKDAVRITAASDGDGDHVSVSIPGFGGKVSLPDMDLGKHVDLDGITLAPDTSVQGVDVDAHDAGSGDGQVRIAFSSPRAPDALIRWYGDQARKAGFTAVTASDGALAAAKGDKHFGLAVAPRGGGCAGTITMQGGG